MAHLSGLMVMALLVLGVVFAIEYKISWTPKRVAANESVVVDVSVDKYLDLTTVELVFVANNVRVSVFRATKDGCKTIGNRFFTLDIVSCSFTHAKIRLSEFELNFASLYVKALGQKTENSETMMIPLYVPPVGLIVEVLHRTPLRLGDEVMLRCHFDGGRHNVGYFSWDRLDSSAPVPGATNVYNYYSEISWPSKIDDQGEYQCTAVYDPTKVGIFKSAPVQVDVQHAPITSPNKQLPSAIVYPVGKNVSFDRHIIANPPVEKYRWEKDGEKLSPKSKYKSAGVCKLHFVVAPTDYGLYSCIAVNAVGKGESHIQLNHPTEPTNVWMYVAIAFMIIFVLLVIIGAGYLRHRYRRRHDSGGNVNIAFEDS